MNIKIGYQEQGSDMPIIFKCQAIIYDEDGDVRLARTLPDPLSALPLGLLHDTNDYYVSKGGIETNWQKIYNLKILKSSLIERQDAFQFSISPNQESQEAPKKS